MRNALLFLVALAPAAVSCGVSSPDPTTTVSPGHDDAHPNVGDLPTTPAAGTVAGAPWTIASAITSPDAFGKDLLHLELSDVAVAHPCDRFASTGTKARRVLGAFAPQAGTYDFNMSTSRLLTFTYGDGQNDLGEGRVIIDEITDTAVKGRISFHFDEAEFVDGAFTAKRCKKDYSPTDDFPADGGDDPRLAGDWSSAQTILGTASGWTWTLSAKGGGDFKTTLRTDRGDVIEDADEHWRFDTASTPQRVIREVIASRKSLNGLKKVGEKALCVYGVSGADAARKVAMTCRSFDFPTTLDEGKAGEVYVPGIAIKAGPEKLPITKAEAGMTFHP